MNAPKLYCLCGVTCINEFELPQNGAKKCNKCGSVRCAKCMWEHLRKCQPVLYLSLRNRKRVGQVTAELEIACKSFGI